MKLTLESYYGIKLVKYLSELNKGEIASLKDIAFKLNISPQFALKILKILRETEMLVLYEGTTTKYELKKEEVSFYEIIYTFQGELFLIDEFKEKEEDNCSFRSELEKIQKDSIKRLKTLKIWKKK